jgi:hypothetical protein
VTCRTSPRLSGRGTSIGAAVVMSVRILLRPSRLDICVCGSAAPQPNRRRAYR